MSSRITPRAIRSLTSTTASPAVRRQLAASTSKAESTTRSSSTTATRPNPSSTAPTLRPLMQGFHTTTSSPAPSAAPSIDFVFLPSISQPTTSNMSATRVPLLPDNYSPDRSVGSAHAPEAEVMPLERSEISIIAARPETVASALTEVVGLGREMGLGELTRAFGEGVERVEGEVVGGLRGLWGDLLDDVLGEKAVSTVRAT
ncbi:hypothetical protein VE02_06310 [Pseudogymnoascus sp. 03VT05]|nr:hypothetical protein VE02_06310 [Pseudogymnoascus sp. 03VT05]